MIDTCNAMS